MTARVFVGCAANHEDAESQAVLEYTLRKHASIDVEIVWMKQSDLGFWSGWDTSKWMTPFSGFRWGIPAYCNYEGRAIYMDSDVIVQADIAELWDAPLEHGKSVIAKGKGSWRFCVSLWDCYAVKSHLPLESVLRLNPDSHKFLSQRFKGASWVQGFAAGQNWNCLDGEGLSLEDPSVKAIHYTAMANQPHLKHAIPRLAKNGQKHWFEGQVQPHWRPELIQLFDRLLEEATAAGYGVERYTSDPLFGEYNKAPTARYRAGPRHS